MAKAMDITVGEVKVINRALYEEPISLDTPIDLEDNSWEDSITMSETIPDIEAIPPEEIAQAEALKEKINQLLLTKLKPREQEIIKMRFGLKPYDRNYTLGEVAKKFHLSQTRLREIEIKALRKLRHPKNLEQLREFIE